MEKSELLKVFEKEQGRFIEEWKTFLRFPSISTEPEHNNDCLSCANWLLDHLKKIGFEGKLLETPGKPTVFVERKGAPGAPTILFYGHYDVQPVDPLDEWKTKPFDPTFIDGRMYARGAQDNKGQVFYVIKALETLIKNNALNATVKMLIEGEEECGSKGINVALKNWKDLIKADILMVCDTGTVPDGTPTIIMGLRGILALTITVSGLNHDLHSGVHGGRVPNPAQQLVKLISSIHNQDGSIAINGYYDDVAQPSEEELNLCTSLKVPDELIKMMTGALPVGGEEKFPHMVRVGFRPTIELNGIHSGYGGPGGKTIIPATAVAKLSARMVKGQDPQRCMESIKAHLEKHAPKGLKLEVSQTEIGGPALRLNPKAKVVEIATKVLTKISDKPPVFLWEGASIPIITDMAMIAGADPILVGFGADEDKIHAPNESFSLEQFKRGFLYAGMFLGVK